MNYMIGNWIQTFSVCRWMVMGSRYVFSIFCDSGETQHMVVYTLIYLAYYIFSLHSVSYHLISSSYPTKVHILVNFGFVCDVSFKLCSALFGSNNTVTRYSYLELCTVSSAGLVCFKIPSDFNCEEVF